jgi:uncharacterized membrane protein YfcA
MVMLAVAIVACVASALTFATGFGLGTLLMPVFAVVMPVEAAVAATGVVHFLNSLLKFGMIGRRAHWPTVWRFGIPALLGSLLGAWWLVELAGRPALLAWEFGDRVFRITIVKAVVAALLLVFVLCEWIPRWKALAFPAAYMPLGGWLSGVAGGLSGMQGALRSAFLARAGLERDAFIGTGVAVACLIDVSRLGVYARLFAEQRDQLRMELVAVAVLAASAGALVGRRYLERLTMDLLRHAIAVLLLIMALAMGAGIL